MMQSISGVASVNRKPTLEESIGPNFMPLL